MQLVIDTLRDALATAGSPGTHGPRAEISGEDSPLRFLRTKLGLTETEEHVLAILAAHELSPEARQLVRELNSEPVLDPTLDTIRRIVYRGARDERAWRELSEGGALLRLGLVEWIEAGTPDHRRTLRLATRVLALVHGVLELDPQLAGYETLDVATPPLADLEITGDAVARADEAIGAGGLIIVCGASGSGRRCTSGFRCRMPTSARSSGRRWSRTRRRSPPTRRSRCSRGST
jgi:hypothetical protein